MVGTTVAVHDLLIQQHYHHQQIHRKSYRIYNPNSNNSNSNNRRNSEPVYFNNNKGESRELVSYYSGMESGSAPVSPASPTDKKALFRTLRYHYLFKIYMPMYRLLHSSASVDSPSIGGKIAGGSGVGGGNRNCARVLTSEDYMRRKEAYRKCQSMDCGYSSPRETQEIVHHKSSMKTCVSEVNIRSHATSHVGSEVTVGRDLQANVNISLHQQHVAPPQGVIRSNSVAGTRTLHNQRLKNYDRLMNCKAQSIPEESEYDLYCDSVLLKPPPKVQSQDSGYHGSCGDGSCAGLAGACGHCEACSLVNRAGRGRSGHAGDGSKSLSSSLRVQGSSTLSRRGLVRRHRSCPERHTSFSQTFTSVDETPEDFTMKAAGDETDEYNILDSGEDDVLEDHRDRTQMGDNNNDNKICSMNAGRGELGDGLKKTRNNSDSACSENSDITDVTVIEKNEFITTTTTKTQWVTKTTTSTKQATADSDVVFSVGCLENIEESDVDLDSYFSHKTPKVLTHGDISSQNSSTVSKHGGINGENSAKLRSYSDTSSQHASKLPSNICDKMCEEPCVNKVSNNKGINNAHCICGSDVNKGPSLISVKGDVNANNISNNVGVPQGGISCSKCQNCVTDNSYSQPVNTATGKKSNVIGNNIRKQITSGLTNHNSSVSSTHTNGEPLINGFAVCKPKVPGYNKSNKLPPTGIKSVPIRPSNHGFHGRTQVHLSGKIKHSKLKPVVNDCEGGSDAGEQKSTVVNCGVDGTYNTRVYNNGTWSAHHRTQAYSPLYKPAIENNAKMLYMQQQRLHEGSKRSDGYCSSDALTNSSQVIRRQSKASNGRHRTVSDSEALLVETADAVKVLQDGKTVLSQSNIILPLPLREARYVSDPLSLTQKKSMHQSKDSNTVNHIYSNNITTSSSNETHCKKNMTSSLSNQMSAKSAALQRQRRISLAELDELQHHDTAASLVEQQHSGNTSHHRSALHQQITPSDDSRLSNALDNRLLNALDNRLSNALVKSSNVNSRYKSEPSAFVPVIQRHSQNRSSWTYGDNRRLSRCGVQCTSQCTCSSAQCGDCECEELCKLNGVVRGAYSQRKYYRGSAARMEREGGMDRAGEQKKSRKTEREEILRKLAMGPDDEAGGGGGGGVFGVPMDRPMKKPGMQSRYQGGHSLQLCFMNEPEGESQHTGQQPAQAQAGNQPSAAGISSAPAAPAMGPASVPGIVTEEITSENVTDLNLMGRQQKLQHEATIALAQVPSMAKMQLQVEKQVKKKSPIAEITGIDEIGDGKILQLSLSAIQEMSFAKLQVVVNDLHSQIEALNMDLVNLLIERDDLHMEQDSMLVDIEDLHRRAEELAERRDSEPVTPKKTKKDKKK